MLGPKELSCGDPGVAPAASWSLEATLLSLVSGEPSRLAAIVSGRTLSLRLTSSRSQQLTEIEYGLAYEIDDRLTDEAED